MEIKTKYKCVYALPVKKSIMKAFAISPVLAYPWTLAVMAKYKNEKIKYGMMMNNNRFL